MFPSVNWSFAFVHPAVKTTATLHNTHERRFLFECVSHSTRITRLCAKVGVFESASNPKSTVVGSLHTELSKLRA
jgi:hypothetical protein